MGCTYNNTYMQAGTVRSIITQKYVYCVYVNRTTRRITHIIIHLIVCLLCLLCTSTSYTRSVNAWCSIGILRILYTTHHHPSHQSPHILSPFSLDRPVVFACSQQILWNTPLLISTQLYSLVTNRGCAVVRERISKVQQIVAFRIIL